MVRHAQVVRVEDEGDEQEGQRGRCVFLHGCISHKGRVFLADLLKALRSICVPVDSPST